jgi:hypothetical protein
VADEQEPLYRRRTPRVTEETPGPGYTCPTPCDDDCEAPCHEAHAADIDRHHPVDLCEANVARGRPPVPEGWYPTGCSCMACDGPYMPTFKEFAEGVRVTKDTPRPPMDEENVRVPTRMTLCPVCGFKRCPGAADHRNRCKGSNQPGQPGSLYPAPPDEAKPCECKRIVQHGEPDFYDSENCPMHAAEEAAEREEEKREHYLANKEDPEEWG